MVEASQPLQENALDDKWYLIHMGEDWISKLVFIGPHQAINLVLDFTLLLE